MAYKIKYQKQAVLTAYGHPVNNVRNFFSVMSDLQSDICHYQDL